MIIIKCICGYPLILYPIVIELCANLPTICKSKYNTYDNGNREIVTREEHMLKSDMEEGSKPIPISKEKSIIYVATPKQQYFYGVCHNFSPIRFRFFIPIDSKRFPSHSNSFR